MIARLVGLGVCLLALSNVSWAQDDRPPPSSTEREFETPRERIEAELERVRATEARLERAMEMLDDGATPQDVRRMMQEGDRRRGERAGRGRRAGAEGLAAEPLTEAQRERALGEIKAIAPFMAQRLRGLAERRPAAADAMIQRMRVRLDELQELRERDPEMAEIKAAEFRAGFRVSQAAREFKASVHLHGIDSEQAVEKREALRAALAEGVDVRLRFHQAEIARLERRIERARAELAERSESRDQFVDERLDEMIERIEIDDAVGDMRSRD